MRDAIDRLDLNLSGATVLTEAASGPYVVTPVIAAMAGAERVFALGKSSRYGSFDEVTAQTRALAKYAGVDNRIEVVSARAGLLAEADVVTNSGHLRPLDAATIDVLKETAVIPLMYEAWEFRDTDLDLDRCRRRGIRIAGTNECHPAIDVFSFLGVMAAQQLFEAGIAVFKTRILLLCDNPFAPFLKSALERMGALVDLAARLPRVHERQPHHAIVVAIRPGAALAVPADDVESIARYWHRAVVAQFFGDVDRDAIETAGIPIVPAKAPAPGHMGVLPSAVGPDPIIRLQSGGLKVAEVLLKKSPTSEDLAFLQTLPS
jgi:hypothetical protein